jgi:HPr kinase/phosphorylase
MGHAEVFYLRELTAEKRAARYAYLFAYKIPCVVFSRGLKPDKEFLAAADQASVPIFQTPLVTMKFINLATLALEMLFAPRGSDMGSMVDILGIGVIIRGESGIGKSESVLALIERGYSLVSDDITRVTLVDGRDVMCTSSDLTRSHMEIRGIGIVNVAAMFGVKSIRRKRRWTWSSRSSSGRKFRTWTVWEWNRNLIKFSGWTSRTWSSRSGRAATWRG